ncbi:hypothetical protein WJX73_009739 [Symbiochloris irregularis]|uniref:Uncharacterized protein n=1 Tax=Symbiochloris irregularis TaxID=706552 RepID=A0AAW1P888_9CHLO
MRLRVAKVFRSVDNVMSIEEMTQQRLLEPRTFVATVVLNFETHAALFAYLAKNVANNQPILRIHFYRPGSQSHGEWVELHGHLERLDLQAAHHCLRPCHLRGSLKCCSCV